MPYTAALTRQKIVETATAMLAEKTLSDISMDSIAEAAGLSKKSLYNHFPSKDHLLTACVEMMRHNHKREFEKWAEAGGFPTMRACLVGLIETLKQSAKDLNWKGCCFVRVSAELGNLPGHPVHKIISQAALEMEDWYESGLRREGVANAREKARQILLLINGFTLTLLQDRSGVHAAAALDMVASILPAFPIRRAAA